MLPLALTVPRLEEQQDNLGVQSGILATKRVVKQDGGIKK